MRTAVPAALLALIVYLRTLAPGLTEIDSGELAAVAATLGIAHPSGYPLFSLLGHVWTMVPTGLRVITWMNALSAVLCAASVWIVARVILDVLPARAGRARAVGAWVGALAFAFHPTLWSAAVVTEAVDPTHDHHGLAEVLLGQLVARVRARVLLEKHHPAFRGGGENGPDAPAVKPEGPVRTRQRSFGFVGTPTGAPDSLCAPALSSFGSRRCSSSSFVVSGMS